MTAAHYTITGLLLGLYFYKNVLGGVLEFGGVFP